MHDSQLRDELDNVENPPAAIWVWKCQDCGDVGWICNYSGHECIDDPWTQAMAKHDQATACYGSVKLMGDFEGA